jgi:predicted nuclease with TOPRIM domain
VSNTYDTNDFGEVLRYADGRLTYDRRDLTEYEEQLIEQLSESESNYESIEGRNSELQKELEQMKGEFKAILADVIEEFKELEEVAVISVDNSVWNAVAVKLKELENDGT